MTKWQGIWASSTSRQDQTWVSSGLAPTPESGSSLAGEKKSKPHISPIKLNAFLVFKIAFTQKQHLHRSSSM